MPYSTAREFTLTGYAGNTVVYNGTKYTFATDIDVCFTDYAGFHSNIYADANVFDADGKWYSLQWDRNDVVPDLNIKTPLLQLLNMLKNPTALLEIDPPLSE